MLFVKAESQRKRSQATQFVVELLTHKLDTEQAQRLIGALDWHEVLAVSGDYLVTPSLFVRLQKRGLLDDVPDEAREALEWIHSANVERNRQLLRVWNALVQTLEDAGVRCLPLKGMALLLHGYCDIGDRVLADLDFMVAGSQLPDALAALACAGYRQVSNVNDPASINSQIDFTVIDPRDFRNRVQATGYQLPAILPPEEEIVLELHYRIGDDDQGISRYMQPLANQLLHAGKTRQRSHALNDFLIAHTFYHSHIKDAGHANGSLDLRHLLDIEHFVMLGVDVNSALRRLREKLAPGDRAALASFVQICADIWPQNVNVPDNMDVSEHAAIAHFNRLRARPFMARVAWCKSEMRRKSRFILAPGALKSLYGDRGTVVLLLRLVRYGVIRTANLFRRKT